MRWLLPLLAACAADPRPRPDPPALPDLPGLAVTVSAPESEVAGGFLAVTLLHPDYTGVAWVDGTGALVGGYRAPDGEIAASPVFARNGTDWLALFTARDRQVDGGVLRRLSIAGDVLSETPAPFAHHALVELPTGELAWLSRDFPTIDGTRVMSDTIRVGPEGEPDGGTVRFDLLDAEPFHHPCLHADVPHRRYGLDGLHDVSHANSLAYDGPSDRFLLGVRLHDAIWAIEAATGAPIWKAGGDDPDLVPETPWSHAHFSEASLEGALVFDNGAHGDPSASRILALAFDAASGAVHTTWAAAQPGGGFTSFLGDARTLPGGNRLVALTEARRLIELAPDGTILWEASAPAELGRVRFTPSLDDLPPG